jgi:hypothetical protein
MVHFDFLSYSFFRLDAAHCYNHPHRHVVVFATNRTSLSTPWTWSTASSPTLPSTKAHVSMSTRYTSYASHVKTLASTSFCPLLHWPAKHIKNSSKNIFFDLFPHLA